MIFNSHAFAKKVGIIAACAAMSGCSFLSPVKPDSQQSYMLTKVPVVAKRTKRPFTLLVGQPDTRPVYNTSQMAYTVRPYQIAYFSQNRWAETPSQMLESLLVQTLQKTNFFRAVLTPPYTGNYTFLLNTQITEFQQDYTLRPAVFRMSVQAELNRFATNQLIASKTFSSTVPIGGGNPYAGVFAANIASAAILKQITDFTISNVNQQY